VSGNFSEDAIGWRRGNVLGLYAHGMFESSEVMCAPEFVPLPQQSLELWKTSFG
jgi:hypothetical protein